MLSSKCHDFYNMEDAIMQVSPNEMVFIWLAGETTDARDHA